MDFTCKLELQDSCGPECLLNSHCVEGDELMMHSENSGSEEGRDE